MLSHDVRRIRLEEYDSAWLVQEVKALGLWSVLIPVNTINKWGQMRKVTTISKDLRKLAQALLPPSIQAPHQL